LPANLQNISEKTLFLRIAEGSEAAFEELYRLYVPQLSSFLQRLSHSGTATDELIQETFLQVWLHRDKLPDIEHPKAWVYRIASNITFNYLNRLLTGERILATIGNKPETAHNDVEETLHLNELKNAVAEAVSLLSPQRKKVYLLSREAGMTIPEIAGQLGLSASTVKNTLVSSLQFIREFLLKQGYHVSWSVITLLLFKK
jgi:RNA polymerase sigma-70 factor (ECF subfamily)